MIGRRFAMFVSLAVVALGLVVLAGMSVPAAQGQLVGGGGVKTQVVKTGNGWELMRGGKPFIVKGVGGDFSKQKLVEAGGNSFRTWVPPNISELDEAQHLGLAVCVGIWLDHNPAAISGDIGKAQAVIAHYKDHPATLMWALGNEMEGAGNDPNLWKAIDAMAAAAHKADPNHPTMTVIAEMGGQKIENIHKYCPNIDIVGINSYAGSSSVPERYKKAGGTKPYIITEFGPPGQWESPTTPWGSAVELTSTDKGDHYRKAWTDGIMAAKGLALGGFAFLWGNKNEATPTWFGMVLTDGSRLAAVERPSERVDGQDAD